MDSQSVKGVSPIEQPAYDIVEVQLKEVNGRYDEPRFKARCPFCHAWVWENCYGDILHDCEHLAGFREGSAVFKEMILP